MNADRTRAEKAALNRISVGLSALARLKNNPSGRAMLMRLQRDRLIDWTPTGWTLTDAGRAVIAVNP